MATFSKKLFGKSKTDFPDVKPGGGGGIKKTAIYSEKFLNIFSVFEIKIFNKNNREGGVSK